MNMDRFKSSLIFQCLLFIIPINIYVIGDWIGTGVQWVLFRYQATYLGTNFIVIFKELIFVQNGNIHGKTVLSIGLWFLAACLMILATIFAYYAYETEDRNQFRIVAILDGLTGILLLVSMFNQYGISLQGPAGFVIPIGIPLLFIVVYWMYRNSQTDAVEKNPGFSHDI